jgi:hypothetical protein
LQKEIAMKKLLIIFFLLSFFSLFMLSCASNYTKKYGGAVQDADVKAIFENYEYDSNYNYFYTGGANDPEAILGIQKKYELVKVSGRINVTNWQQFEPGGEKLKELVEAIKAMRIPERRGPIYGYIIIAPGGDQAGVMYTPSRGWGLTYTDIRLNDGNLIAVTPHNDAGHAGP